MTGKRLTNYFENQLSVPVIAAFILADLPVAFVPTVLSAIETRKGRSFWVDRDQWSLALDGLNEFQRRLLMDASDRIVNEVRALRDGNLTPAEARDPLLDPYTLPLTSLRTVAAEIGDTNADLSAILATTNETLQQILTAVQTNGASPDITDRLDTLIYLLGAL